MTREERLKALFDELERDAYNAEYHNYYYKEANQIIRKHFEQSLPPAEGAEAFLITKFHSVSKDPLDKNAYAALKWEDVINLLREFATLHASRLADKMVSDRLREEFEGMRVWTFASVGDTLVIQ